MITLTFLMISFVIIATPSTGAVYSIAAGLSRGAWAGVWAAFACTVAIVPHLLAAMTGLATILHTSALAFNVLKYLGVIYLFYMAWQMWKDKRALNPDNTDANQGLWQVMKTGILINLLNPKLTIFFFAFLPQFVSTDGERHLFEMVALSAVFMLMTFVVFAFYGVFAARLRTYVLNRPKVLDKIRQSFALVFVVLGLKLAISER